MLVHIKDTLLKQDFVRFCIVGFSGFLINLILLTILYKLIHSPLVIAQLIAAETALFSNFMLHHHWTYKANKVGKEIGVLILQFHATSWVAIIGSTLMVTAAVEVFHINYFFGLVISSAAALLWNYAWSKYVIWRKRDAKVGGSIDEPVRSEA
ncbi:MAG: GtrA family protein [Candidatus Saccharimonadales bacterium]